MTIKNERIVFDTNIWIFGLQRHPEHPFCAILLEILGQLNVVIPRQILRELRANFAESELKELFRLLNQFESRIVINWEKARIANIEKYCSLVINGEIWDQDIVFRKSAFLERN